MTLYRVVQNHLEEFVRQFKWALSSRQVFEWQKMTRPETLTDTQYAGHHAFAAKVRGGRLAPRPHPGWSALNVTIGPTTFTGCIRLTGRRQAMG
ncbi:hypothetical protein BBG20_07825 [Pseudomonas aylmerensis]|uniref:Uncharacterized protein n=1 Tax=Pseudomonas aylmerensis TaxID=1869229 RepID=A0ABX2YZQ2_9PSED|nr:hypothetical protein BBG20_07825 [Pseudomonas aylmerensis]